MRDSSGAVGYRRSMAPQKFLRGTAIVTRSILLTRGGLSRGACTSRACRLMASCLKSSNTRIILGSSASSSIPSSNHDRSSRTRCSLRSSVQQSSEAGWFNDRARRILRTVMPRGLDHIVHAVRDLDAAADLCRRLGFNVGARNRHPWGTHNHIVQLPGFFIELLTLAEPEKIGDDGFSRLFAAYNRDFVQRHEGLSLLIVESQDADADASAFRSARIADSD